MQPCLAAHILEVELLFGTEVLVKLGAILISRAVAKVANENVQVAVVVEVAKAGSDRVSPGTEPAITRDAVTATHVSELPFAVV